MPGGFLAVLSEPGQVSLEEFHDWYDNEHIPLRLNHLPAFLTGARFKAIDGVKPSWLALYDIDSSSTFSDPSYTRLRENRSPREEALIKRLDVLDRRICEVFSSSSIEKITGGSDNESGNTGLAMGNPTQWIFTHWVDFGGRNVEEEAGDPSLEVHKVWRTISTTCRTKGLIRSRLFRCMDRLETGLKVSPDLPGPYVPRYFALHGADKLFLDRRPGTISCDICTIEVATRDDLRVIETGLEGLDEGLKITEGRLWQLHRAYPCVSQGNLP